MRKLKQMMQRLQDFRDNKQGFVAAIYAIALVPLLGTVALSIDYAMVTRSKTAVNAAADAATLAAVSDTFLRADLNWTQQKAKSEEATQKTFEAILKENGLESKIKTVRYKIEVKNNVLSSTICYTAHEPAHFIIYAGVTALPFEDCSTSTSAPPVYVRVVFLVDASASMGIGATAKDQETMRNKLGCEFACHSLNWNSNPNCDFLPGPWTLDKEKYAWFSRTTACAHKIGARTRFDVAKEAMGLVLDDAKQRMLVPDQFSFETYKFSSYLTNIHQKTYDIDAAKSIIARMQQDTEGAGTNLHYSLKQLIKAIPQGGDGKSKYDPKVYVMLITDGLEDSHYQIKSCQVDPKSKSSACINNYWITFQPKVDWITDPNFVNYNPGAQSSGSNGWPTERVQGLDPRVCAAMKDKKVLVGTLNTEYILADTTENKKDFRFTEINNVLKPKIRSSLQTCASDPDFAFLASSSDDLKAAARAMFSAFIKKATITN